MSHEARATPETKAAPFYEGIKQGKVLTSKCRKCGFSYFPPRSDCNKCYSSEMDWQPLSSDHGFLVSFTTIHNVPASFQGLEPYTIALVQLDTGHRVEGLFNDKTEEMKVGERVRISPKATSDGRLGLSVSKA